MTNLGYKKIIKILQRYKKSSRSYKKCTEYCQQSPKQGYIIAEGSWKLDFARHKQLDCLIRKERIHREERLNNAQPYEASKHQTVPFDMTEKYKNLTWAANINSRHK